MSLAAGSIDHSTRRALRALALEAGRSSLKYAMSDEPGNNRRMRFVRTPGTAEVRVPRRSSGETRYERRHVDAVHKRNRTGHRRMEKGLMHFDAVADRTRNAH